MSPVHFIPFHPDHPEHFSFNVVKRANREPPSFVGGPEAHPSHQSHERRPSSMSAVSALSPRKLKNALLLRPSDIAAGLPRFNGFSVPTQETHSSPGAGNRFIRFWTRLPPSRVHACLGLFLWMHGHFQTASGAVVLLLSTFGSTRNRAAWRGPVYPGPKFPTLSI